MAHKIVTVYSCGDSTKLSTWSNVPYLFCQSLENKGIKINRVNIEPNKKLSKIFNYISFLIFRRIFQFRSCPEYHRTLLHRFIIQHKLRKAAIRYKDSDMNLFLSYAFINRYSNIPNILWCDWTDRVVIERQGRGICWYEKKSLAHEDKTIRDADVVYTMFPVCKEHMEQLYGREFRYLDRNVINTVYDKNYNIDTTIEQRYISNNILFIGNHRYQGAAEELISACDRLRKLYPGLNLHIIGMTSNELHLTSDVSWIKCYGYLHKDKPKEKDLYYELLLNAKVFVNPAAQWGGYSSTVEAMYYGCPVIVSPYDDFAANFGKEINFGIYHKSGELTDEISTILNMPENEYKSISRNAANSVKDYTWDNYINLFLNDLKKSGINLD